MKTLSRVFVTALCSLALLGAGCLPGTGADRSTPEAAVNGFFTAVQAKDQAGAKSYLDTEGEIYGEFDDAWGEISQLDLNAYSIESKEGNKLKVKLELEQDGEKETDTTTVEVVQKGSNWLLVSF
jgi:hypothetical protein